MNAGKAPPPFTARSGDPQTSEAGVGLLRRSDVQCAARRADGRQAAETCIHQLAGLRPCESRGRAAPRWPRKACLGRGLSSALLSKFAGLPGRETAPDTRAPL